jgi:hypothetical protein
MGEGSSLLGLYCLIRDRFTNLSSRTTRFVPDFPKDLAGMFLIRQQEATGHKNVTWLL